MTRPLLFALLIAVPAAAAPLPDAERERLAFARTFGVWTDPTGENAFRADGQTLRVRLPGPPFRAGLPVPSVPSVSRFVRRVEGDFTVVVRVTLPPLPDGVVADGRRLAGGLMAVGATGEYASLWRGDSADDAARYQFGTYQTGPRGRGVRWSEHKPTDRSWLRLTRTGASVSFGCGPDETSLKVCAPEPMGWVGPIEVGVFAENTTGVRAEVTFDRYSLTQPKKEATP